MTVQELTKLLQKFDPELDVRVESCCAYVDINSAEVEEWNSFMGVTVQPTAKALVLYEKAGE